MCPRHRITPHGQLIHGRVIDIVRRVQAYQRRKQRPRAKRARRQCRDVLGDYGGRINGRGVVDARGEGQGAVGLDAVSDGYYRDLFFLGC